MSSDHPSPAHSPLPPSLAFAEAYQILQVAFDRTNSHTHVYNLHIPSDDRRLPTPVLLLQPMEHGDDNLGIGLEYKDEKKWCLRDVFERKEWKI